MSEEKSGGGISLATKSTWKTPENFFPIVVDNFFDAPEAIVEYGKSLPKEKVGQQPGMRSKQFWEIDEILHNTILKKILNCYYDLDYVNITWNFSNMNFHEIPRFSEDKNDIRNRGWIHQDNEVYMIRRGGPNNEIAGLIYLTPDIDPDSGTSLFDRKSNQIHNSNFDKDMMEFENDRISDSFDIEKYTKIHIDHEENFKEKLRFQNIFNRLIMYDTDEWHRANSYYNGDGKDARLTLAFFIGGIEGSEYPLKRVKSNEYESVIKDQIGKNENK